MTRILLRMTKQVWMVRAGRDSRFIEEFLTRRMVAIGWSKLPDLSDVHNRAQMAKLVEQGWPENNKFQNASSVGQVYRFREDIVPGTTVVTYDSNRRIYHLGIVTGDYVYHPEYDPELGHTKAVKWNREVSRDVLSAGTKNSLGSISTVFCLSTEAADELVSVERSTQAQEAIHTSEEEVEGEAEIRKDTEERALGFLQDKLTKLDWDEMQELVAGVLRAMGYKTRISPAGPDRGRDILASPDGFGFQPPRIVVEVKHRKGTIGAPEVRSFVGGLRQHDNGLYVSTGGFTREARYEADRTNQNVTLMDAEGLGKAIVEHYDAMDSEARALLPLRKIYWPV